MKNKNFLKQINIIVTICAISANIISFFASNNDKSKYISINAFFSVLIFFLFWYLFKEKSNRYLKEIKNEAENTNYPIALGTFCICIFTIIFICTIILGIVNKDALNLVSVFTFFLCMMSMLTPSILLMLFTYFIMPAFIIPSIKEPVNRRKKSYKLIKVLFILFILFYIFKGSEFLIRNNNFENQSKYKIGKILVEYSRKHLNIDNISRNTGNNILDIKFKPFIYTLESFPYNNYDSAEGFCESLNARVPNAIEMFHIAFNKNDTFGEKYYWTSNTDGRNYILLKFNNMSYSLTKYNSDMTPGLYCVSDLQDKNQKYLYKNSKIERKNILKDLINQKKNTDSTDLVLEQLTKENDLNKNSQIYSKPENETLIQNTQQNQNTDREKKHVNFNVKLVNSTVFNELISKGYDYNPNDTISNVYETTDTKLTQKMNRDSEGKKIRLCYFPYTDYNGLNIYNEKEIWHQSFCSPSFELTEIQPVLKTRYEKDSYCWSKGGRLPNIPELVGILKNQRKSEQGIRYWTNITITDGITNSKIPIKIYYKDSRFIVTEPAGNSTDDSAYTYCIKPPEKPSSIITNFKSRFVNEDGSYYAKLECPSCAYYELPDTILLK